MERHERAQYIGLGFLLGVAATLTVVGLFLLLRVPLDPVAPSPGSARSTYPSGWTRPTPTELPEPAAGGQPGRRESSLPYGEPSVSSAPLPTPQQPEWTPEDDALPPTLSEQRQQLLAKMQKFLGLSDLELAEVRKVFDGSRILGQGNPKATTHPMSRAECRNIRRFAQVASGNEAVCGKPYMVPVYDRRAGESEVDARLCVDQYEFPDIPCEYPITWVRGLEAARLCKALGKRMCDAHEWEAACAGSLRPLEQEYDFSKPRREMRYFFNKTRELVWAYGPVKHHNKCATGSQKGPHCYDISWQGCGSNTYPAGAFLECVSSFGVYDQHGNAAEHMNMPLALDQLASRGEKLGETEMKGSWFIFGTYEAHEDDCRWRAPDWHRTRVMDVNSHANYHLGFRCCRDVVPLRERTETVE